MEPARHTSNKGIFFPSPPEGPDEPTLPYLPGFSIQVSRHAPPPAYATPHELDELGHQDRPLLGEKYFSTVTQSEAIALNPPVEGIPSAQTGTAQMTITSLIAIGAVRVAQVVGCTVVLEDGKQFAAYTKIYDSPYYNFTVVLCYCPDDCVHEADDEYMF